MSCAGPKGKFCGEDAENRSATRSAELCSLLLAYVIKKSSCQRPPMLQQFSVCNRAHLAKSRMCRREYMSACVEIPEYSFAILVVLSPISAALLLIPDPSDVPFSYQTDHVGESTHRCPPGTLRREVREIEISELDTFSIFYCAQRILGAQ